MTILVRCSDPRINQFLENEDLAKKFDIFKKSYGIIANTGSIKYFMQKNQIEDFFEQLGILIHHFNAKRIILTNHTDCGYYKKLNQDEEKFYLDDLIEMSRQIENKFSDVNVEGYLIDTKTGKLKNTMNLQNV